MRYNFKRETQTARLPTRHTEVSAGVDFYADEEVYIPPGGSAIVPTGISWNPDLKTWDVQAGKWEQHNLCNVCLIIQSRSGIAFTRSLEASNAGVIDRDYVTTIENKAIIHVKLYNHGTERVRVDVGEKICQGVPQFIPHFTDVKTLDTTRNGLGFGSSDNKENQMTFDFDIEY